MKNSTPSRWRVLWVIPPLAIGILVLLVARGGKQPPAEAQHGEPSRAVRIIEAPQLDFSPRAEGYGTVQPAQVWTAVAQVSGRVIEMHPKLRDGELLPAGTVLFLIDPVDYELNLAQAEASLAELEVQRQNAEASLEIEQRNLALAGRELTRISKLAEKGTTSQSSADEAERGVLTRRVAVQNLENTLALIPTQRRLLDARRAQAERDLANTRVSAPFNMRVAGLAIEADQFVSKGQNLFQGDATDRVEITAQIALSSLRNLFIGRANGPTSLADLNTNLSEFTGFKPRVRLDMGGHVAEWQAEFVRFSDNVDAETRTMGVVVAVDDPLGKIEPGYRPPLSKGMFVQVIVRGHTQPQRIVLPREAIRAGRVYTVDAEQRLRSRQVEVLYSQGRLSVIGSGVQPGEQIVVSDLVPAVDGMLLQPEVDAELQQALRAAAGGEA